MVVREKAKILNAKSASDVNRFMVFWLRSCLRYYAAISLARGACVRRNDTFHCMITGMTMLFLFFRTDKMSDRKAVIKNADMSEEMQQDAVDCATQALEKYNIEKVYLSHFFFQ